MPVGNAYLRYPLLNTKPKSDAVSSHMVVLCRLVPFEAKVNGFCVCLRDRALLSLIARVRSIVTRTRFSQHRVSVNTFAHRDVLATPFVVSFSPMA